MRRALALLGLVILACFLDGDAKAGLIVSNPVTAGQITLAGDVTGQGNANTVTTISGTAPVSVANGALSFSVNPSATGNLRLPNNTTILAARNAGNGADLNILATDSGNDLTIGNQAASGGFTSLQALSSVYIQLSGGNGALFQASQITIYPPTIQYTATTASPTINQAASPSTSSGSGSNGQTMQYAAQSGQAATGASNNGGNGGALQLVSGAGGTSGSATAGVAGPVQLQVGASVEMQVGPTASSGGPAGIGFTTSSLTVTASSNTTVTPSASQYRHPYQTLTGTLTGAAIVTIALPNIASNAACWWFDDSGVTFTSGTLKWQCNGGAASAGISALSTTSEIIQVCCRGTTVSINQ